MPSVLRQPAHGSKGLPHLPQEHRRGLGLPMQNSKKTEFHKHVSLDLPAVGGIHSELDAEVFVKTRHICIDVLAHKTLPRPSV